MRRIAIPATVVVVSNIVIGGWHGLAHWLCDVPLLAWQQIFVLLFVFVVPSVALGLYWTRFYKTAGWILSATMLASTTFGVYFHFIADTGDHVSYRNADCSGMLFTVSAAVLVSAGLLGLAFGMGSALVASNQKVTV